MKCFNLLLTVAALTLVSCNGLVFFSGEDVDLDGYEFSHDMIVLGDRLEDPYSLDVMTKALASLYPTKSREVDVKPTDLYVRFLPETEADIELLESMGVELLDHPVDYQILRDGDYYHDPSIDEGSITWMYSVVKSDFVFPASPKHELLYECLIPNVRLPLKSDGIDWAAVEREAFRISGNGGMLPPETKADEQKPKGRITIVDREYGNEPIGVKGVRVSCNTFCKLSHAYTDDQGYYQIDKSFSSNPRYRLVFKNSKGFGIGFNKILEPASCSTLGKGDKAGIDHEVTSASDRKLFTRCAVNNAAYDYYEKSVSEKMSILAPPVNLRIWIFQALNKSSAIMTQQGALVDNSIISKYLGDFTFLLKMFLPDITLGVKGADRYSDIYSLTVHELAHASHFQQVGKDYWNSYIDYIAKSYLSSGFVTYGVGTEDGHGYCEVGEMWAYYMQTSLFNERYPSANLMFGTGFWFHPQILYTLELSGLSRYRIFKAMTDDIHDVGMLQKKLTSLNPEFKSAISQAFSKYM